MSSKLLTVVGSSHSARARARVVTGFPQSTDPAGAPLQVLGGDVTMSSSATVRATGDVTVAAPWGYVLPNGAELFLEYGVEIAGGQTEWVSLGYFGIYDVDQDGLNAPLRLALMDRMEELVQAEAVYPWVAPVGTTHQDLFSSLVYGQPGGGWFHPNAGALWSGATGQAIVFDYDAAATRIPIEVPIDRKYQEVLQAVADTLGLRMFFDYLGRLNVVSAELSDGVPVLTLAAGEGGAIKDVRRQLTRRGVYNSVRAQSSEATEDAPPWGYAVRDSGAMSWYGQFGKRLRTVSSPLLTSSPACYLAAERERDKISGLPYSLEFALRANPALEPLDPIEVRFPGPGRSQTAPAPFLGLGPDPVAELHVIDSIRFPLAGGDMKITTRATQVAP